MPRPPLYCGSPQHKLLPTQTIALVRQLEVGPRVYPFGHIGLRLDGVRGYSGNASPPHWASRRHAVTSNGNRHHHITRGDSAVRHILIVLNPSRTHAHTPPMHALPRVCRSRLRNSPDGQPPTLHSELGVVYSVCRPTTKHMGAIAGNSRNTPPSGHPQTDRPTNMFGGFRNRHNGQPQRTPPVKLCSGLSSCPVVSAYSQPIPPTKPCPQSSTVMLTAAIEMTGTPRFKVTTMHLELILSV